MFDRLHTDGVGSAFELIAPNPTDVPNRGVRSLFIPLRYHPPFYKQIRVEMSSII